MVPQPRHFVKFMDGRAGDRISIAFLPGALGAYINTLQTDVSLRLDYARKLISHGIKYEAFLYVQETIDNGMCMLEDAYHLRFLYVRDAIRPEIYFLLLKTDRSRRELWLVTFHRLRKKQFSNRIDPGKIIRPHAEQKFMG
jgi:hypothetical protein